MVEWLEDPDQEKYVANLGEYLEHEVSAASTDSAANHVISVTEPTWHNL